MHQRLDFILRVIGMTTLVSIAFGFAILRAKEYTQTQLANEMRYPFVVIYDQPAYDDVHVMEGVNARLREYIACKPINISITNRKIAVLLDCPEGVK